MRNIGGLSAHILPDIDRKRKKRFCLEGKSVFFWLYMEGVSRYLTAFAAFTWPSPKYLSLPGAP